MTQLSLSYRDATTGYVMELLTLIQGKQQWHKKKLVVLFRSEQQLRMNAFAVRLRSFAYKMPKLTVSVSDIITSFLLPEHCQIPTAKAYVMIPKRSCDVNLFSVRSSGDQLMAEMEHRLKNMELLKTRLGERSKLIRDRMQDLETVSKRLCA